MALEARYRFDWNKGYNLGFNDTSEQLTITPSDTIQTNANYTINFKYTGTLSPYYTAGFFYTYYIDLDGNYQ